MTLTGLAGLVIAILAIVSLVVFTFYFRKRPLRGLRSIAAYSRLKQAIGLAVENGSCLHVSIGKGGLNTPQGAAGLVGLTVLDRIAHYSFMSDHPPIASSGDGSLSILSQDTLCATYRDGNVPELFDPNKARLTGPTPLSYIAGAMPFLKDEDVSVNVLTGNFGPEIALLLDASDRQNSFSMAATDSLPAQSVLYAMANEPLIGEELYAVGAYLQAGASHSASLRTQDILRWLVVFATIAGAVLKLIGIL
jgi:hypothetical protein